MASKNINPKKVDGSALPTSNSGLGSDDLWQDNGSVRVGTSTPTSFLNISNANLTSNGSYGLDLNGNTLVLGGTTTASTETISIQKNTLIKTEDTLISSRGFKVINSAGLDMLDIRNNGQIGYGGSYNATVGHFFKNPTNAGTVAGFRHQDGSAILNVSNTNRNLHLYSHTNQDSLIAGQWGNDSRLDFYHKGTQLIRLNNGTLNYFNIPSMIFGGNVYIGTEDFSIQGDTLIKGSNNSVNTNGFKVTDINDNSLLEVKNNGRFATNGSNVNSSFNVAPDGLSTTIFSVSYLDNILYALNAQNFTIRNTAGTLDLLKFNVQSGVTKLVLSTTTGSNFLNLQTGTDGYYARKININSATASHDHAVLQLNQSSSNVSQQLFFANITTTTLGRNGSISGWGATEKGFECFDTTTNKKHVWNGTAWEQILSNTTGVVSASNISNADLTFGANHYVDLDSNEWSIKNGSDSYFNIKSTGEFVIGKDAQNLSTSAQKEWNTIIGYGAKTTAANIRGTVSIGYNATTSNTAAIAIGDSAISSGASSIAILGNATKSDSIAIGKNTNATGNFRSIAIGTNSSATYNQTVAIGSTAQATHNYAQAFGTGANATQTEALAVGYLSKSSAIRGIAIGTNNEVVVNHNNSIVIGSGVSNTAGNQLSSTAANQFVVGFNSISPTILIGSTTDSYIKSTGTLSLETNTTVKGSDNSASTTGFKVTDINDDSLLEVKNNGVTTFGKYTTPINGSEYRQHFIGKDGRSDQASSSCDFIFEQSNGIRFQLLSSTGKTNTLEFQEGSNRSFIQSAPNTMSFYNSDTYWLHTIKNSHTVYAASYANSANVFKEGDNRHLFIGDLQMFVVEESTDGNVNLPSNINLRTAYKTTGGVQGSNNVRIGANADNVGNYSLVVKDDGDSNLLEVKNTGEVVIGTTSSNDSAKLQVDSTTQGFAGPRMTTTERNNISTPIAGLEVYDTTLNSKMIYNGTSWDSLLPTSGGSGTKVLVKGAMGANQTATPSYPIVEFITTGTPTGGAFDINSEWNNTTHRFTVGSSGAGTYLIQSQLFLNNGTGWSTLFLYKNGSIYSSFGGNGTDTTNTWDNLDGTIPIDLVVGDYIDIRVYSSSNGTINFNDWASRQSFSITKLTAVAPAAGTDVNALHTNISNEINSVTEKTDPSNTDKVLIEESDGTKKSQSRKNFKRPIVSTTTTSSSLTPLVDDIEAYVLTSLSSNITINAPTGTPYDFQNLWFRITDNGTSRTITKNAIFVDYTGNFPTSTTINKQLIFASQWDGSNWNILAWKIQP